MKHSTKYWIKLAVAMVVFLSTPLLVGRLGVDNFWMAVAAGIAASWIVFWVLWPRVWYFSETTKGEVISYNVFAAVILVLALIFR